MVINMTASLAIHVAGMACKKDAVVQPDSSVSKKELSAKDLVKPAGSAVIDLNNPPIGGPTSYPHSTGICYCGVYSVCHPIQHNSNCGYSLGTGVCTSCPRAGS